MNSQQLQRYMRKLCIQQLMRKWRLWGNLLVDIRIYERVEDSERGVVDEILRDEQKKRGLR